MSWRDLLRRWFPPGLDQQAANAQILELAARFPIGSEVMYAGQPWRVIGHREVGLYGPWLSIGAIPMLLLRRSGEWGEHTAGLSFDQVRELMREQPSGY
jgi:hypothetical protein